MNLDSQRWRGCAWLRALVFQWHKSRGFAASNFQRPYSRDWEELLQAGNLISAELRAEAFREAKELEAAGLVDLKTVRYRPYQIERIVIPFAAEPRLREMFAGELPEAPDPRFDFTSVQWASPLAFLTSESVTVAPDDLLKLNEFLLKEPRTQTVVPIKERSLANIWRRKAPRRLGVHLALSGGPSRLGEGFEMRDHRRTPRLETRPGGSG